MLRLVLCCRQGGFRSLERVDLPLPCFHTRLQLLGPLKGREPVGASHSATRSQTHTDKDPGWSLGVGLREALRRDQIYEAETAPPAATIIGIAFFAAIGGASECARLCSVQSHVHTSAAKPKSQLQPAKSVSSPRERERLMNENSLCSAGCSVGLERLLQLLWASRTLSPRRGCPLCRAVSHGGNWAARPRPIGGRRVQPR